MSFIAAILAAALAALFRNLIMDFAKWVGQSFRDWLAHRKAEKKIKMDAEAFRIQTEAAVTPEERDRAARDTVRNGF